MRIARPGRRQARRGVAAVLVTATLATLHLASVPAVADEAPTRTGCTQPVAADRREPQCNPFLADSPWPGAQRGSYAQHSSPLPGPSGPASNVGVDHLATASAPVILSFSPLYPDGKRVIWASTVGVSGEVLKIDPETTTVLDKYIPQLEAGEPPISPGVSGAYNLVDADNRLVVGTGTRLQVFGDAVPGLRASAVARLHSFELPARALCGKDDQLVGITMTYAGRIAFATKNGVVGTVPRQPAQMTAANLRVLSINGSACGTEETTALEQVSNSISSDERGGIYVVTSEALYRFADGLLGVRTVWRSPYSSAATAGSGRIGAGSGSTPSLMGTRADEDRFVVITDGQEQVHLDLMWRDEIPADWKPVRPGASRRIACEVPVTFGQPPGSPSVNEQSVLVRGNAAILVNNRLGYDELLSLLPSQLSIYTQLLASLPGNAPQGMQRIDWDPRTRTCRTVWTNPSISIPNGIPTLSSATGLVYGIGVRNSVWTLEGIDLGSGEVRLTVPTSASITANSAYAATTIGPDGTVWTGTFGGVTRFRQCAPAGPCAQLGPLEAIVGTLPQDPADLLPHLLGLPNP